MLCTLLRGFAGLPAILTILSLPAAGQTITPLLLNSDSAPPPLDEGASVSQILNLAINDSGHWLVECDTNFLLCCDQILVRDGVMYLWEGEGEPWPAPPGTDVGTLDSVSLTQSGLVGWNMSFTDHFGGGNGSGVYVDSSLVIRAGDISTAAEFTPGTPYVGFLDVKLPPVADQILIVASVDDPAIATAIDRAIVRVTHDGSGNLVSESVLAKEGDVPPGQVQTIADIGIGPHQSAFNDAGDAMFVVDLNGVTTTDGVIYLNEAILAQEGSPSPVPGRSYELLLDRGIDLSNNGEYVFKANLDGATTDDDVIVRNGDAFVREGDTLPGLNGFLLTSFGTGAGPLQIDDVGHVLWFGDWNDPDTNIDTGLFLNDRLVVQEGVTIVNGIAIGEIASGEDAFALSDNGMWAIFEGTLVDGRDGAFLINFGGFVGTPTPNGHPAVTALLPPSPNPMIERTELRFTTAQPGLVSLAIYDVAGRIVQKLANGVMPAGQHLMEWDGRGDAGYQKPAGIYFVRLTAGGLTETKKIALLGPR